MSRPAFDIEKLRAKHRVVSSIDYQPGGLDRGYTRKWLRVDIGSGDIAIRDTTDEMIGLFINDPPCGPRGNSLVVGRGGDPPPARAATDEPQPRGLPVSGRMAGR